jgi:hypothetical protein
MQYFTLIGGFLGFILTLLVGFLAGKDLAASVFNATIGCIFTAFLFRGLRFSIEYCARQVIAEKTRERDKLRAAEEASAHSNSTSSADSESSQSENPEPDKTTQGAPA